MSENQPSSLFQHPARLLEMSQRLIADGQGDKAVALAETAIRQSGGRGLLAAIGAEILSYKIPRFHASMLRDGSRNTAYAAGVAATAKGRIVLDIGTGSGLLAMIAARAGALHVYACELDQRVAATAREIIAANGLADRITVLPVHSSKLDPERDLGGGVDLVVSEIFSDNLLGEGVLPSLEDARKRLCLPDAQFLPSKAAIRIALVGPGVKGPPPLLRPIDIVEGCDLSLFNRHVQRRHRIVLGSAIELRSEASDLFVFDFDQATNATCETSIELRSHGGPVSGVAQWIWFEVANGHEYENFAQGHWQSLYYAFDAPIDTTSGQRVKVNAWHDEKNVLIWNDGTSG